MNLWKSRMHSYRMNPSRRSSQIIFCNHHARARSRECNREVQMLQLRISKNWICTSQRILSLIEMVINFNCSINSMISFILYLRHIILIAVIKSNTCSIYHLLFLFDPWHNLLMLLYSLFNGQINLMEFSWFLRILKLSNNLRQWSVV